MLTYGFYNSVNHDRRYDAKQVSSIFDGIIKDGVYMAIGNHLNVIQGTGMMVLVDTGRAWFNHTWTLNDARLPITIPQSEVILKRIDAVVLEVNHERGVRANSIKVVKGTPSSNPQRPTMVNTQTVHQYPLAFVSVPAGATTIRTADITNMVGTSQTPFVTGVIQTMNIDTLIAQWKDQWDAFYEKETNLITTAREYWIGELQKFYVTEVNNFQNFRGNMKDWWIEAVTNHVNEMDSDLQDFERKWNAWFYSYTVDNQKDIADWKQINQEAFDAWFDALQVTVDENVATNLANELIEVKNQISVLQGFKDAIVNEQAIYDPLYANNWMGYSTLTDSSDDTIKDSDSLPIVARVAKFEPLLDSDGRVIDGRMLFAFL